MQKAGVELIVEGLMSFGRDMEKANSAVQSFGSNGTLLTRTFGAVSEALQGFGGHILDVAKVALGVLLRDAINAVINSIKELIGSVIEAGSEFQLLGLRLDRLNTNWLMEKGGIDDFSTAMEQATEMTKDQLTWIQKLAVTTPYDAQDIANVYTLARSYSFADGAAQSLTGSIVDFASGMGLGNEEIERIIVNFGQLVQQGKLNGQELRDLARGAFVPVNDILTRMRENMGLTTAEFEKMRKGGQLTGDAVQEFIGAFQEIVSERFTGAAENMARSWQGATDNVKDFFKSILGLNIAKPILDSLGGAVADLLTSLTKDGGFDLIAERASRFGRVLGYVLSDLLDLDIDLSTLPKKIGAAFDTMTTWVYSHKDEIKNFFIEIGDAIREKVIPFILSIVDKFNTIKDWVSENGELIKTFFSTLGEIIAEVFGFDTSGLTSLEDILAGVKSFMEWVIDNKDAIADWAAKLLTFFLYWQIGATILQFLIGIVVVVIGFFLGLFAVIASLSAAWSVLTALAGVFGAIMSGVVGTAIIIVAALFLTLIPIAIAVAGIWLLLRNDAELLKSVLLSVVEAIKGGFEDLKANIKQTASDIVAAWKSNDWPGMGKAIIDGVIRGVKQNLSNLISLMKEIAQKALDAAQDALGIGSPSKEFEFIGKMTITGLVEGIQKNARKAERAMQEAVARVTAPALNMPGITQSYAVAATPGISNTYQTSNNWNLTIHSGAQTEQVVQDYNMMQSLASS